MLGVSGVAFLNHAMGAIQRILPHVEVTAWQEGPWKESGSVWNSQARTQIRITLAVGEKGAGDAKSLNAIVSRRRVPVVGGVTGTSLDMREFDICKRIVLRASEVLQRSTQHTSAPSLEAIAAAFDEYVVAYHLADHLGLGLSVSSVFRALHTLSGQSYENKAITFGCILDPKNNDIPGFGARFPDDYVRSKKYKALSDGFRTAFLVSGRGSAIGFVDIELFTPASPIGKHYYPGWAEPLARASRGGKCGIALSRQGDILVFDEGTLRFSYRYGRWQYWNHSHLVNLLRDRARAPKSGPSATGRLIASVYRAALDVSFRRSGGLFFILRNRQNLRKVVRNGDAIGDRGRSGADLEFDNIVDKQGIQILEPFLFEITHSRHG